MKTELLTLLCCPSCSGELGVLKSSEKEGEIESGILRCAGCSAEFPVVNFVPRFVPAANYCGNFGFQWNRFSQTQLDSCSGVPVSRERFLTQTGWDGDQLRGAIVLDAGCGSGRFAEVALDLGATVVAVDYSSAIEACWRNLRGRRNFHAIQADIRNLPLRKSCFDCIYSFGVLQHTPDPHSSFKGLPRCLKEGGKIAVDVYRLRWKCLLMPKYWLRPLTKRLPPPLLFRIVNTYVPILLPLSSFVGRIPGVGSRLRYLVPIANYTGVLPLNSEQQRQWAILDTFDMLSPAYDLPQTGSTLRRWFGEAGLQQVQIQETYLAVGTGKKGAAVLQDSPSMAHAEGSAT
jgi:SAM-dependent methyltransferase